MMIPLLSRTQSDWATLTLISLTNTAMAEIPISCNSTFFDDDYSGTFYILSLNIIPVFLISF